MKKKVLLIFFILASVYSNAQTWDSPYNFPKTRDVFAWPFADSSIWNTPIGSNAQYVSYQSRFPIGVNNTYCDDDIIVLTPTVPLMDVYQCNEDWGWGDHMRKDGGIIFSAPIPQDFYFSRHGNACLAVLLQDKETILSSQPFYHYPGYTYGTSRYDFPNTNIYTDGIWGSHGGAGMSAIGGTIRMGELAPGAPPIHHALKMAVYSHELNAHRWPAPKDDAWSPNLKTSGFCDGALSALLPSYDIAANLETEVGKYIARACQDYGIYLVDGTGWDDHNEIMVENGPDGWVVDEVKQKWNGLNMETDQSTAFGRDMKKIYGNLYIIENNASDNVGGGGTWRAPLAPPFGKRISISIVQPAKDTILIAPATITIKAEASTGDSVTVKKVEFHNGSEKIGEALTMPYTIFWSGLSKGEYTVSAVMIDSNADTITSSPVHLTVLASHPPEVFISAPVEGSVYSDNQNITLTAIAKDNDGNITKVAFFEGETKLGECLETPYNYTWSGLTPGIYAVTAVATDNSGISTTSKVVHFTFGDCDSGTNLISNPEFDDSTTGWKTWNDGNSAFTKSIVNKAGMSGENALLLNISKTSGLMGIRLWTNLDFKSAHDYQICFLAKSTENKQLKIAFKERGLNGPEYWSQNITIDTLVSSYGPYFFHCDHDYANGELDFFSGSDSSSFWLDRVRVADQSPTSSISVKQNEWRVFPNPVTGQYLTIETDNFTSEPVVISIFNAMGQKVFTSTERYMGSIRISVGQLMRNGIYLVKIQAGNQIITNRIIVPGMN